MTLEDFDTPLQTKVYGTRNLYAAFEDMSLDFFVTLSSISGILGTSGQANYVAGNAFQDAFANCRPIGSFPCISLDIGLLGDGKSNNSKRERNLARHGAVPIGSDELISMLEYGMTPQAAQNQCKQLITGFDAKSLSRVEIANANTNSPLFCHIRQSLGEGSSSSNLTAVKPLRAAILESSDVVEVYEAVTATINRKLSRLIATDDLHQKLDTSMAELGLDSLITIEFRDWISTEFQAATQVSEILDQTSIRSLASLVASRSKFILDKVKSMSHDQHKHGNQLSVSSNIEKRPVTGKKPTFSNNGLPTLPLPDLDNTLSMYLDSRKYFLSQKELAHTSKVIADFLQVGGFGRELQGRLEARLRDSSIENWLSEPYSDKIYLERRDPIHTTGTFFGGHLVNGVLHTQAERAAVLSIAALMFKHSLEAGTVECDTLNGEPICMESLRWLFNTVREPRIGVDKMLRSPGHDYIIALRRGHIFKISLNSGGDDVSYWRLKAAFEHVLASSKDRRPSVATLTADERSSWAKVSIHLDSMAKTHLFFRSGSTSNRLTRLIAKQSAQ